jgi:hypothetical protein
MVDLLIKLACFCNEANNVGNIQSSWYKFICTMRLMVLSLPLQQGFPDKGSIVNKVLYCKMFIGRLTKTREPLQKGKTQYSLPPHQGRSFL